MYWFLIALAAPFLYSIANFIDKILLSKFFRNFSLFVFMIYSAITTAVVLPIFIAFGGADIFQIPGLDIFLLVVAGISSAGGIYFYLLALNSEETSVVVPFFQLAPIFTFVFGFAILRETLSGWQIIGSLIIILGTAILSFERKLGQKIKFKKGIVFAMIVMSVLVAFSSILFKFVAEENNFWISNFWESMGFALVGVFIFLCKKNSRKEFYNSVKIYKARIVSSILLSEVVTLGGNLCLNFAFLLAPVALVRTVEGYQSIFAFIIGIAITKVFPKVLQEKTDLPHLVPKFLTIIFIFIGSYLILN